METTRERVVFLLVMLGIPVFGWAVGAAWAANLEGDYFEAAMRAVTNPLPLSEVCLRANLRGALASMCETYWNLRLLRIGAIASGAGALALVTLVSLTAQLCGGDQRRLARIFAIEVRLVVAATCVLILAQGAILTYAAYVIAGRLPWFVGAIGLGALVGAFRMIRTAVKLSPRLKVFTIAQEMPRSSQPRLWAFVDDVASRISARVPTNIVVGVHPTFYATAADVQLTGTTTVLRNETMHLSAPLLRVLSTAELAAIVGHELGHFKGSDTEYTLRFVPIYRGIQEALGALGTARGLSALSLLPARAMLRYCLVEFASAQRAISRLREIAADKSGAAASSPTALIAALIKIAVSALLWPNLDRVAASMLNEGRMFTNISAALEREVRRVAGEVDKKRLLADVVGSHQAHPTDTHPTLEARADALDVPLAAFDVVLGLPAEPAIHLLDDTEAIETALTDQLAQALLAIGAAKLPDPEPAEASAETAPS
jgi:Zn-dependent protease with chaperone function